MLDWENVTNQQIAELIDTWIHSERDREILHDRLINGYTFSQLANKYYPLTYRQIQRVVQKAGDKLFKHL